jgi:hypothetical protein
MPTSTASGVTSNTGAIATTAGVTIVAGVLADMKAVATGVTAAAAMGTVTMAGGTDAYLLPSMTT